MRITTLGAATQDVFLMGTVLKAKLDVRTHDYIEQFPLGAKLELDKVVFSTGGGATNAAVTFARAGFETFFMGKIGDDIAGKEVLKDLKNENISTKLTACDTHGTTGYSTLLLAPRGERTILVYRGVSENLKAADFDYFSKLKSDWLYISSLAGNLTLLEAVIHYANTHNIKVAINPGKGELNKADRFKKLLPKIDILSVNKEEMKRLYRGETAEELINKAAADCRYVVMTDGPKGSWASDGENIYRAGMYKDVAVLDRTGAGDAFCSGFVARIAKGKSVEDALSFASANSTSVVQHIGSKEGILHENAKIEPMKVKILALARV